MDTNEINAPGGVGETARFDAKDVPNLNKAILLEVLKAAGATVATVEYAGAGDEGSMNGVLIQGNGGPMSVGALDVVVYDVKPEYRDGEWIQPVVQVTRSLEQALSDFADEAVSRCHPYWGDGEGAAGEVIFTTDDDRVRIEHRSYYVEHDYTETDL